MDCKMFCFQCEQTSGGTGCTKNAGVCGKRAETAGLQDELTGAVIGLARAAQLNPEAVTADMNQMVLAAIFSTLTNVNFYDACLEDQIKALHEARQTLLSTCKDDACVFAASDYDMKNLWNDNEDIRSLKSLILFGIRGLSAYAYHASVLGAVDEEVGKFILEAMVMVGKANQGIPELLPVVLKVGEVNLKVMLMLEKANVDRFGKQVPTNVTRNVEKGPFIVITGHDLVDLEALLKQTEGKGINIYTHGEMITAHAYPELKKYPHLKGNYGTAWQNQTKEFENLPAPIVYTSNCLVPTKKDYIANIYTTEVVGYEGATYIGADKDFTPVIEKALALGGYAENQNFEGMNGGDTMTVGFGKDTILGAAGTVVEAVKAGAIKHFFLVAGCDGAKPGRSYYTDFVKATPDDTIVLTLACGKYRFNDMDLGTIGGLPRLMDMGQCNDAVGAIQVAVALAEAFGCEVNELPLSMVLSWYEQKAVCILLTLLHLGIKDILLGPSLPAFISPNVLNVLVENYNIGPIGNVDEDLKKLLG